MANNIWIERGDKIVRAAVGAGLRHAAFKAGCQAIDALPNDENGLEYIQAVKRFVDKVQRERAALTWRLDERMYGGAQDWPAMPYTRIER